jgi:hypothetical protein
MTSIKPVDCQPVQAKPAEAAAPREPQSESSPQAPAKTDSVALSPQALAALRASQSLETPDQEAIESPKIKASERAANI